jgi:hypothetical protein
MTVQIVPSGGAAPLWTQQGQGTSPGYAALDDRRANYGALQEGVYGTSTLVTAGGVGSVGQADFMVTARNAGANMSVDINMPAGGFAYVQGDTINGQGLYTVPVHSVNINETIAAADPSKPRVDQVILEVQDNVLDASGGNLARTRVLTGTPTTGTTLTSRAGAAALPGSSLLLGDVLVAAAATTIGNAAIRDRRKWARGMFVSNVQTIALNCQITGTVLAQLRLECSGAPIQITIAGVVFSNATGSNQAPLHGFRIDNVAQFSERSTVLSNVVSTAATAEMADINIIASPAAGSHLLQWTSEWAGDNSGNNLWTFVNGISIYFREMVTQNANNSAVTSG